MNIQSNYNSNNNISMQGKRWNKFTNYVTQKVLDCLPKVTIKETKRGVERSKVIDDRISKPAENRLIMGATAMLTQPAIDYYNHRVDEDTRRVARNRTIAKIIAGTCVGILVRGSAYKAVVKMTDVKGCSKFSKSLLPKKHMSEIAQNEKFLKNYRNALSSSLAILAMCVTNFVLDAPLTVFLTNKFNETKKEGKHE